MFDLDNIKSGEQLSEEQLKELFGHEDKESSLPENVTQGKAPAVSYNPVTGTFDVADAKIKELRAERDRLKIRNDPLAEKQRAIELGLEEMGISGEKIGKTGDSRTGNVTDEQKKIAESQVEDAKMLMAHYRNSGR